MGLLNSLLEMGKDTIVNNYQISDQAAKDQRAGDEAMADAIRSQGYSQEEIAKQTAKAKKFELRAIERMASLKENEMKHERTKLEEEALYQLMQKDPEAYMRIKAQQQEAEIRRKKEEADRRNKVFIISIISCIIMIAIGLLCSIFFD